MGSGINEVLKYHHLADWMPEQEIQRLYFSIGEVSEKTGVEQHVLRYWETVYKELSPRKSRTGKRLFRSQDIEIVEHIKSLLYKDGYKSKGAQEQLKHLLHTEQSSPVERQPEPANPKSDFSLNDVCIGLKEIRKILDA